MKYLVSNIYGESTIVEARSINNAINKSGYNTKSVETVVRIKPAPTSICAVVHKSECGLGWEEVKLAYEGIEIIGKVEQINKVLAAMGYGEVKIVRNLMSGKHYVEAVGTPGYCSPSSEAYWSM